MGDRIVSEAITDDFNIALTYKSQMMHLHVLCLQSAFSLQSACLEYD